MHLLLVVDEDVVNEIVAFFLLADETKTIIKSTVNIFKKYYDLWSKSSCNYVQHSH